jgi:hypothetical protein
MHVYQPAKLSSRVCCPLCGQEFLIYAESGVSAVDTMSRRVIEHALRKHHTPRATSASAHPGSPFHIRNWAGAQPFLASAALNNVRDGSC